jgi:hypothetical protein
MMMQRYEPYGEKHIMNCDYIIDQTHLSVDAFAYEIDVGAAGAGFGCGGASYFWDRWKNQEGCLLKFDIYLRNYD